MIQCPSLESDVEGGEEVALAIMCLAEIIGKGHKEERFKVMVEPVS